MGKETRSTIVNMNKGGKRLCSKGKSCGTTCIEKKKICKKDFSNIVSSNVNKLKTNMKTTKVDEKWFEEGSFKAFKRPAKEPFEIAKKDGTIQTLEGPVSYKKGFYIMTGPNGEKYPITPESFAKLKVDNGDGTASPKKIVKAAKIADHSGSVNTSWGEILHYSPGVDVIVRHGPNDYGVVKKEIFDKTYETESVGK